MGQSEKKLSKASYFAKERALLYLNFGFYDTLDWTRVYGDFARSALEMFNKNYE